MKKKAVGLYDPYLDTLGGGEKYFLSIAKALEENYEIDIFWNKNLQNEFKIKFNLSFNYLINFLPNIFLNNEGIVKKILLLRKYDYFFYVTDGSYFFSSAKKNFIYAMVPNPSLYKLSLSNKFKLLNYEFITHSEFTKKYLKRFGINSLLLYPYLDQVFIDFEPEAFRKEKIILSVGRFFSHLHSKRQNKLIEAFQKLKRSGNKYKYFKLILAGGLKEEDKGYYKNLQKMAKNDSSIIFKPNISFSELLGLYKKSLFYWHFTGFGIDESKYPEVVEHLGIAPLEAMAMGCITFCVNSGGPKELIQTDRTGFLFKTEAELFKQVEIISKNYNLQKEIRRNAKNYISEHFTFAQFKKNIKEIII